MKLQQQFLDIFEIRNWADVMALPNVTAKRNELRKLYKKGGPEIPQAEADYFHLVNDLCLKYGLPPYFKMGAAHPPHPFKQPREPAGPG